MSSTLLSVNVNKVALLRNSRSGDFPNLVEYAQACIDAGAQGITIHPRPDQRHICASDCAQLKSAIDVELNIEGNPFATAKASNQQDVTDYPGFMELVLATQPAQCTLVPDDDHQLTSDHGFDLKRSGDALSPLIDQLKANAIRVSIFVDPVIEQVELAQQIGADRIELYTGPYAHDYQVGADNSAILKSYVDAATCAQQIGLEVNAGHDLNLLNLQAFKQALPILHEVSIGHALTVDALYHGLKPCIGQYLACLE